MCGFIGFYNKNGVGETEQNDAAAMSHAIRHRGPDLDRAYGDGRAHFAFRRLSIIDLEGGSQPFVSEDGRYFAVYNGEVYNYLELRDELISRGTVFRTRSEIETIVALYAAYGASFINRLRGMFAFLLYDSETGVLMAGRDPFGIKPLYYRETADGYVFASEMKAYLFDSGYDGFKVDPALLQHYLTFQYVTEPDTLTGDIRILPKGSYMLCDGEHTEINAYYRPVFAPAKGSYAEKKLRLREAVENSVASHMLSDVPLGSFLSSGVDSAVITAVASKLSPGIKAFTVGFDVPGYSELEDAAAISAHLDIDHVKLACTLQDFTDSYEKVIYHLDSPVGDPSVVAIYLISQEAARHVKVILSGEGSDELFGGYRQYAHRAGLRPAGEAAGLPQNAAGRIRARAAAVGQGPRLPAARADAGGAALRGQLVRVRRAFQAPRAQDLRPVRAFHRPHEGHLRAGGRLRHAAEDAVLRPEHLAALRHPRQGRPPEHGARARGAGALSRQGGLQGRPLPVRPRQALARHDQIHPGATPSPTCSTARRWSARKKATPFPSASGCGTSCTTGRRSACPKTPPSSTSTPPKRCGCSSCTARARATTTTIYGCFCRSSPGTASISPTPKTPNGASRRASCERNSKKLQKRLAKTKKACYNGLKKRSSAARHERFYTKNR